MVLADVYGVGVRAWAQDPPQRLENSKYILEAIDTYTVEGVATTLSFGKFVFNHEAFRSGNFDTHFVKNYYTPEKLQYDIDEEAKIAALFALKKYIEEQKLLKIPLN